MLSLPCPTFQRPKHAMTLMPVTTYLTVTWRGKNVSGSNQRWLWSRFKICCNMFLLYIRHWLISVCGFQLPDTIPKHPTQSWRSASGFLRQLLLRTPSFDGIELESSTLPWQETWHSWHINGNVFPWVLIGWKGLSMKFLWSYKYAW